MSPFLRDAWYAAAFSSEVGDAPFARTLLDRPIVFYRASNGEAVALEDRCPHRFAPLSLGRICGDDLQCGYHGLRFDRAGRCVHNPHGASIAAGLRVAAFPVVEKFGWIWLWAGDRDRVDPAMLPDYGFLADTEQYCCVSGLLHVRANYQLIVDNLLDLSHAAFLHPHFAVAGASEERSLAATKTRVDRFEDRIHSYRLRSGLPPNRPDIELFDFGLDPVDSRSHMTWYPPALLHFDLGTCLVGTDEKDGLNLPQAHCITPETGTTSHYFYSAARNRRLHDKAVDDALRHVLETAFRLQDEPMIEAIQRRMGDTDDLMSLAPVMLATDGAPMAARRLLSRLIVQEQARTTAGSAVGAS